MPSKNNIKLQIKHTEKYFFYQTLTQTQQSNARCRQNRKAHFLNWKKAFDGGFAHMCFECVMMHANAQSSKMLTTGNKLLLYNLEKKEEKYKTFF